MVRNISRLTAVSRVIIFVTAVLICQAQVSPQPLVIKLWHNGVPGAIHDPAYFEDTVFTDAGLPRIRRVTDPEMFVYLPNDNHTDRTAVIICPGGGYARLAIDHEGHNVAKWLNQFGVVGIVLKYRLPSDQIMKNKSIGPLQDVQEAIRITRRKASEWKIDPDKIGIMGFSAGGHVAASASTLYEHKIYESADNISARPDFSILIYGVLTMRGDNASSNSKKNLLGEKPDTALVEMFSLESQVNEQTPPAFIVHSANDTIVSAAGSIQYFSSLKRHSIPAELHIYETGRHGYGLARDRKTEAGWTQACVNWMKMHGLIH